MISIAIVMEVQFTRAEISHQEDCLDMIRDFYLIDGYGFDRDQAAINFQEMMDHDHLGRFWVLQVKEEIIGYLILTFGYSFEYGGRDAFIDEFYLKEAFRGKGLGTEILTLLDGYAKELNVNAIHLEVERTNQAGNSLYLKTGFKGNDRSLLTKTLSK